MIVRLAAEAEGELVAAAKFYAEASSAALGGEFVDEVDRACKLLAESPLIGRPWHHQTRRLVLRRFPFNLIYRVCEDEIQIVAIAHQRRRPGHWSI